MNNFLKNEKQGRELFEQLMLSLGVDPKNMFPSRGEFNPCDYFFKHKGRTFCVEIKVRDKSYLNFPTHFLEMKKAKMLLESARENKCSDIIYVNFFGSDQCVVYNVKKALVKYRVDVVKCNKRTAIQSEKVDKPVICCPKDDGIWLKYVKDSGIWSFSDKNVKKKL